jgi:hypothetical protein
MNRFVRNRLEIDVDTVVYIADYTQQGVYWHGMLQWQCCNMGYTGVTDQYAG